MREYNTLVWDIYRYYLPQLNLVGRSNSFWKRALGDEEWCDIAIRIPDLWAMAKGRRDDFSVDTE